MEFPLSASLISCLILLLSENRRPEARLVQPL